MSVDVFQMSTREPDVAHTALNDLYCPETPMTFTRPGNNFLCQFRATTSGDLGADRCLFTTGLNAKLAPMDYFLAAAGVRGALRYQVGRDTVDMGAGVVFRYPTDAGMASWWHNTEAITVRVPLRALERVAAERFDTPAADLRMTGLTPVSEAARRSWLRLMRTVQDHLADPTTGGNPLVTAAMVDLVATTALSTFANTTQDGYLPGPGYVAPASVRRAVAYIDEHAAEPMSLSDIAAAAGVGPRALQLAFRNHLECPPLQYARRVRLEAAHRQLQAADPTTGSTVTAIAAQWGFTQPGRFAAAYRDAYGVTPAHTLRT